MYLLEDSMDKILVEEVKIEEGRVLFRGVIRVIRGKSTNLGEYYGFIRRGDSFGTFTMTKHGDYTIRKGKLVEALYC